MNLKETKYIFSSIRKCRHTISTFGMFFITMLSALIGLAACNEIPEEPKSERPNILIIMSDDHAVNAIGCYGEWLSAYAQTDNIDKLAAEGIRFENCFATNSICSPSRASILTGKYSHKNGVYRLRQHFDDKQPTSASVLQAAGYQTAIYGKWHLDSKPVGFDDYKVLQRQGRYVDPEFVERGADSMETHKGWVDDITADFTMDFIRNRKSDQPFLVMCNFKAVHDPWSSREPFINSYDDIEIPIPDNLCDNYQDRGEVARRTTLKFEMLNQSTYEHKILESDDTCAIRKFVYQQYIKSYLKCARTLDQNVGKVLDFMKAEGLDENTIIVYTSDQGHFLGEHGFFSKRLMYDESVQMPLIIKYPGKIKPGTSSDLMVSNIDIAPTILDFAGIPATEGMQGRSVKDIAYGNPVSDWKNEIYFRYYDHMSSRAVPAYYGIRTLEQKLIYYHGLPLGQTKYPATTPEWEFFDLRTDPSEMHNLYDDPKYADQIKELKEQLLKLKVQYGDTDDAYPELVTANELYFYKDGEQ